MPLEWPLVVVEEVPFEVPLEMPLEWWALLLESGVALCPFDTDEEIVSMTRRGMGLCFDVIQGLWLWQLCKQVAV